MSRDLTPAMESVSTASVVRPFLLFAAYFDSGTFRAWNGIGDLSWNGETWNGTGNLLSISPVSESEEVRALGAQFNLSGIPSELISVALSEPYQGRVVEIYLGAFDASGVIVTDPCKLFSGRLDVMEVSPGVPTATILVSAENRLIDLERPRVRRYTNEDQQNDYPGDKGMEYVASLQEKQVIWNR